MRIGRIFGLTAIVLAASAGMASLYVGWDDVVAWVIPEPVLPGVRKPLFPDTGVPTAALTTMSAVAVAPDPDQAMAAQVNMGEPASVGSLGPGWANVPVAAIPPLPPPQRSADDALPARAGQPGISILQIGDNHTSADFLTGELRERLQARYGQGAPGYVTAGRPHIGVRSSVLKITASSGWSYKSLQNADAVPADFWLSGYNAIATAAGETMTFASERPVEFEMIEIEVLRQPGGGKIDVRLDGSVQTSYDLSSPRPEPVVIRLLPTRGATGRVREIAITTTAGGPVTIASVALYDKRSGLTFNSVGYPGAQAGILNTFNGRLLADGLARINPQIVVLSFGTNEAANEHLDVAKYRAGYERVVDKIRTALPKAQIVVIGPPDSAELPPACQNDRAPSATCGNVVASGNGASGSCAWRTPEKLPQVREVQREIAARHGLVYWNWASIMPSECGAHRWYAASPQLMAKDHLHLTIDGYKKSADQFLHILVPIIEKMRTETNAVSNN